MDLISDFVSTRVAACHPRLLEWQGAEASCTILDRWLREHVEWLRDEAALENYAKHCPVPGAEVEDYGIRSLRLEGSGNLLAGIHFYGCNIKRPFVHVTATDFELSGKNIRLLSKMLEREFEVFRPDRFRVWIDGENDPLVQLPGADIDNWFLAGSLAAISERAAPDQRSRISLEADPEVDSYGQFTECYAGYHDEQPGTAEWNSAADRDLLEKCAKEDGYFRVHVDGEPAGWIAAGVKEEAMLRGWCMMDELLEPSFRGQGLGAAMQRAFLDALPEREPIIWGTIDPRNEPSIRTAKGVGREIVCGYLFLPFY